MLYVDKSTGTSQLEAYTPLSTCRDHPEKELAFKIARKEGVVDLKVVTELDRDGDGKIGAQLATYAKLTRKAAAGPIDAAGRAAQEFTRMVGLVGKGERFPTRPHFQTTAPRKWGGVKPEPAR